MILFLTRAFSSVVSISRLGCDLCVRFICRVGGGNDDDDDDDEGGC